jgi:xanthine/uracil/vitamin C permease (AzgA family)
VPDAKEPDISASKISKLFDIRLIVGGLLAIYGVILTIKGIFDNDAAVSKAAGIRLNLWTGIGMLVVGLLMLLWMRLRPLDPPAPEDLVQDTGPRESKAS